MMWIILSVFDILFAYIAEIHFNKNRLISIIALLCIIILNTIILGFRDFGVGTDTLAYVEDYFNTANKIHNLAFLSELNNYDKGYLLLALFSTLFSSSPQSLLFFTELFIISFYVLGLYETRKVLKCNLPCIFLLFVLLYQFETINLMRQFCAMSLLVYGFSQFLQKHYKRYLFLQILGYFFHSSSILFIIIPILQYLSNSKSKLKYRFPLILFVIISLMFVFYYTFIQYFSSLHIISGDYAYRYGESTLFAAESSNSKGFIKDIVMTGSLLVIIYLSNKKVHIPKDIIYMGLLLIVFNFMFSSMRTIMIYFFRLGYYWGLIMIIYLSVIFQMYKRKDFFFMCSLYLYLTVAVMAAYRAYGYSPEGWVNNVYRSKILSIE
ncbi:MAG: EpsG family protein [Pseudobutyrivibrio sp.]|nr:EpsG family protein [Pseudobutyrivibrio sp.]